MSTTDPDGNPELANIGNALDGTLDISTEDVEEVPSEDEAIAGAAALDADGDGLLAWLKKKRTKVYRVVTRLNRSAQTDQNSAEKWNILTRGAIQNLSDLHRVEKEIAKIHTPTKKETETMKAYKKVAKATIATLEKRRDSQAKVETAGTEEGEGAGVLPDPESDVDPDGEPNLDNPEGDNDDETVAPETGTIPKKAPTKVHFEETKVTKQQPLPPTVGKGPGKVIPEKRKPGEESESGSGSDSDSSDDEVTFLKKLVSANAFTEAALREELARKDQELKKADFRQDDLRQKVDREKRINFNLTAELQREQVRNQPDLTKPRGVPLDSESLGAIPKTRSVLDDLDEGGRANYEQSRAERNARKTERDGGPNSAYTRGGDQFFHSSPSSQARDNAEGGSRAAGGGQPPGDKGPPKGFSFGAGVDGAVGGGNVSGQNDSSTFTNANDPLKGLDRYKMTKFTGDEKEYAFWKLSFQQSYGARQITEVEKVLYLLRSMEGEPHKLCKRFVRYQIDQTTYDTIWEVLDGRYGGDIRQDQQVQEEFDKVKALSGYDLKDLQALNDSFVTVRDYYRRVDAHSITQRRSLLSQKARKKLGKKVGSDYLLYLAESGLEDTFNTIMRFVSFKLTLIQRLREFTDEKSVSLKFADTYQVDASEPETSDEVEEVEVSKLEAKQSKFSKTHPPAQNKVYSDVKLGKRYVKTDAKPKQTLAIDYKPNREVRKPVFKPKTSFISTEMCPLCSTAHPMFRCRKFLTLEVKQRFAVVQANRLCFHCLNSGHRISKCTYNQGKPCGIKNCVRYHHPLLHVNQKGAVFYEDRDSDCSDLPDLNEINFEEMDSNSDSDEVETFHVDVSHVARAGAVSLQTLVCDVKAGGKSQRIIVLLDSGSNSTLIDQALASKLRAKVVQGPVTRKVNYVDRQVEVESSLVSFVLTDVDGRHSQALEAWTVKDLAKRSGVVDWSEQKRKFEHLRDVPFVQLPKPAKIDVLIGTDNHALMRGIKVVSSANPEHPWAVKSPLGWTCVGPSEPKFKGDTSHSVWVHNILIRD